MSGLRLNIWSFENREKMGIAAARDTAKKIQEAIDRKGRARVIFASAPSQDEMLDCLSRENVDWTKVTAFHMDEYLGLKAGDERLFGAYIKKHLFDKIPIGTYFLINPEDDPEKETMRYGELIREAPIDVCCMGIGENGHLAFNEPAYANFKDPETMKRVALDDVCRRQQVNDGCFSDLNLVPREALTLTIPVLMSVGFICCTVPGITKREILHRVIASDVEEKIPATVLKQHENCRIYTDQDVIGHGRDDGHGDC